MNLRKVAFLIVALSIIAAPCRGNELSSALQRALKRTPNVEKVDARTGVDAAFEGKSFPVVLFVTVNRNFEKLETADVVSIAERIVKTFRAHSKIASGLLVLQRPDAKPYRAFEF